MVALGGRAFQDGSPAAAICISQSFSARLARVAHCEAPSSAEISPPRCRRLGVALEPLLEQRQIEQRVRIGGVGLERSLEAAHRLGGPALVVEEVGEIVPGRREGGIGLDGVAIGGFRLDAAAIGAQQVAEIEGGGRHHPRSTFMQRR